MLPSDRFSVAALVISDGIAPGTCTHGRESGGRVGGERWSERNRRKREGERKGRGGEECEWVWPGSCGTKHERRRSGPHTLDGGPWDQVWEASGWNPSIAVRLACSIRLHAHECVFDTASLYASLAYVDGEAACDDGVVKREPGEEEKHEHGGDPGEGPLRCARRGPG